MMTLFLPARFPRPSGLILDLLHKGQSLSS